MNFITFSDELLRHRPPGSAGIIAVEQVDSTVLLGRRIVEEYTREGSPVPDTEILAWCQVSGRGRQGRAWSSPPGHGIYTTLIRSSIVARDLQLLPLRAALALCEAANRHLEGRCRLKWPNDLLVGQAKLGGILIEAITQGDEEPIVMLSAGINYAADLATIGEPGATSLRHEMGNAKEVPSLAAFALEIIEAVDGELERATPAAVVIQRYGDLSIHQQGEPLRCRLDEEILEGRFLGFDERGFLRLEIGDRERLLSTGEILSGE